MDSPWCPVFFAALAASLCASPALADRKFGCLFEDELCAPYEFCINDGLFGRCQELAGADLSTYDISSSVLQRLRVLLQKLAHRGLTWQDDITQQVVSRELSKLRTIPLRQPSAPPSRLMTYSSSKNRKPKPAQAELSKNLQQYLTGLGFLPQAEVDQQQPGAQREIQNEDINTDSPSQSKPKQGWKETTIYSLQKGAGHPPVTKVISKSGEGRHPKLSTSYSSQDKSKLLSNHLEQLLSGASGTQQGISGGEAAWPKGKLHYLSYMQPVQSDHAEPQAAFGSKTTQPDLNRLLFKAGSNRLAAKEPTSAVDEHFFRNAVNHLGRHSVNMEDFMGNDLDHLAEVITGALQKVNQEPGPGATDSRGETKDSKEPPAAMILNQDQNVKSQKEQGLKEMLKMKQQGQQIDGVTKESIDEHSAFFSKLLDYLNMEPFGDAPGVNRGPTAPLQKLVGLESVHSRTMQGEVPASHLSEEKVVTVPEKEGSLRLTGPPGGSDSEIERWMQADQAPAGHQQPEEPQKKDMKIKTQLVHVGVKEFSSRGKDRHFGYIITGSESLTNERASVLMERLTQRLKLHATDLTQLSVLGPALTFRVGPNPKNVTTADLVQAAVQDKQQLEKETGLKIVEAGVSDRGSLTQIPVVKETRVESGQFLLLSILCMLFILVALAVSATFFCVRQRSHLHMKEKLASLGTDTSTDATAAYQELCRQRMAIRTSERVERPETLRHSRLNSVSSQFSDGPAASPSARSSTSSWCEEPVPSNMDISTGHMILSYMEDHLKNKNRLEREWEALCSYQAEPGACSVGQGEQNSKRNRSDSVVVYDHSRITLKAENNHGNSDYINASPIMDHDPRNPTYVASQGPLVSTVADFWQMVWEQSVSIIAMVTAEEESGREKSYRYWPRLGSRHNTVTYGRFKITTRFRTDSGCYATTGLKIKHLLTGQERTVWHLQYTDWPDHGCPEDFKGFLSYLEEIQSVRRHTNSTSDPKNINQPVVVHCSAGVGRSGVVILSELMIACQEHNESMDVSRILRELRDQRMLMVQTLSQYTFVYKVLIEYLRNSRLI
uniref:Protein tyrosine phosphatase, receptor type, N polypeptide 2 n=1 Tax=Nothobranchius kadleci TaxID=1051664 RepID=A0A1A8CM67_NOTKA